MHISLNYSNGTNERLPDSPLESEVVLRMADRALYLAKKLGRDRVELAPAAAMRTSSV